MSKTTGAITAILLVLMAFPAAAGTIFSDNFQSYAGTISATQLGSTWQVVNSSNELANPSYVGSVDMIAPNPVSGPLSTSTWTLLCGLAGGGNACVDLAGSGPRDPNTGGPLAGVSSLPTGGYLRTINLINLTPGMIYSLSVHLAGSQRPTNQATGTIPTDPNLTKNVVKFGVENGSTGQILASNQVTVQQNDPFNWFAVMFVATNPTVRIFLDNSANLGVVPDSPGYGLNNPGYNGALLDAVTLADVPEPGTLSLMGLAAGIGALMLRRRVTR